MSFGAPFFLLSLLALPVVVYGYAALEARRRQRSLAWARAAMQPNSLPVVGRGARRLPAALFLISLALLLIGFARPQLTSAESLSHAPVVVLAFDISGSMAATDVKPSRIAAARALAQAFVKMLPSEDAVGVVEFGSSSKLVLAPTASRAAVAQALPRQALHQGTAIGEGVAQALAVVVGLTGRAFPGDPHPPGCIVVFSDGGQNAGGLAPLDAAGGAYADGIPIDTFSVGTARGYIEAPVKVEGVVVPTRLAAPVSSAVLRAIARASGGVFVSSPTAAAARARFPALYKRLRAEPPPQSGKRDLSGFVGGAALICVLAAALLSELWFGRSA